MKKRRDDFNLHVGLFGPVFCRMFRESCEMLRPSSPQHTGPVSVLGSERSLFFFFVRERYKKRIILKQKTFKEQTEHPPVDRPGSVVTSLLQTPGHFLSLRLDNWSSQVSPVWNMCNNIKTCWLFVGRQSGNEQPNWSLWRHWLDCCYRTH